MKFEANGPRKVYNFDLDGVLAMGGPFWEREPEPNHVLIGKVRELYQAGNVIIIWTARLWEYAPETVGWLTKHKVPFHGVYMSKGGADVYIDDKAVNLEVWTGDEAKKRSYDTIDRKAMLVENLSQIGEKPEVNKAIVGLDETTVQCPECYGLGTRRVPDERGCTSVLSKMVFCERCKGKGWLVPTESEGKNIREKLAALARSKLRAEYAETEKRHEQTLKEVMEILRPLDKLGIAGLGLARAELQRRLEEG